MAYDLADVRTHILNEMDLREEDLGTAVLKVEESHAEEVWTWDYADSAAHDFGTVTVDDQGNLNIELHPESAAYSEGWVPNDDF